jgi:hypothetical protein
MQLCLNLKYDAIQSKSYASFTIAPEKRCGDGSGHPASVLASADSTTPPRSSSLLIASVNPKPNPKFQLQPQPQTPINVLHSLTQSFRSLTNPRAFILFMVILVAGLEIGFSTSAVFDNSRTIHYFDIQLLLFTILVVSTTDRQLLLQGTLTNVSKDLVIDQRILLFTGLYVLAIKIAYFGGHFAHMLVHHLTT